VSTVAEARATTRRVARTFSLACRLLPADVRDDVYLLYLVFRTLDDLVDEARAEAPERLAAVEAWAAGEAAVRTPEVEVLDGLAARHPIPRAVLAEFCEGMRWDLERRAFRTEAQLDAYCYRVAGTVGIVMASVLGTVDDAPARPAAAALGMAMQRTNILRDLDEDRAAGRTYLAQEATDRFGMPVPGAREALLRDQIAKADARYDEGIAGIALLRRGRAAIRAAAWMYREILRQIEREGLGARPGRASVSGARKLWVAARRGLVPPRPAATITPPRHAAGPITPPQRAAGPITPPPRATPTPAGPITAPRSVTAAPTAPIAAPHRVTAAPTSPRAD
jgi:phytoene synthase